MNSGSSNSSLKCRSAIWVVVCTVILISLSGCGSARQAKVIFLKDLVYCDLVESGDSFGFNLTCLYAGRKPQIEFVSFDNDNANSRLIEMKDDTFDSIVNRTYDGYRCIMLGFLFDISAMEAGNTHFINEITLKVNGREEKIDVTGQIRLLKVSDTEEEYWCEDVYSTNVPVVIFSNGKPIECASFNYRADRSVTIHKFEFSNFLNVASSVVFINGRELGCIDDSFPLSVPEGSAIRIDLAAGYGEYDVFSDFYVDSLLFYTGSDGKERILKDYVTVQAVANFDDLSNLIDSKAGQ